MNREFPLLLVIENDPAQQSAIRILAKQFGYMIVLVETGEAGLAAVNRPDFDFQAILANWTMADMGAFEFTRRVRQLESTERHIPIIATMMQVAEAPKATCREAGMNDCVSKPFCAEDLRRILLRWTYDPSRPNLMLLPTKDLGSLAK